MNAAEPARSRRWQLPLIIASGFVSAEVLTWLFLDASVADLAVFGVAMTIAASMAWALGYLGLRIAAQLPGAGLRLRLVAPVVAALATALASLFITSWFMFISSHDLTLLAFLLLFAVAVSLPVAFSAADTMARRVSLLGAAAQAVSEGELATRVEASGSDELSRLARSFNQMAVALEAAQRQRMELEQARKDLVAAISHDLRTPLSSIRVMVEAISDDVVDSATARTYLAGVLEEVRQLGVLIDDLFELSQIDSGALRLQLGLTDIGELITDTVAAMRPQAEARNIHLSSRLPESGSTLLADSGKLQRALSNLVQNALRHTPSDGVVMLEAVHTTAEIVVSVSDSGEGIAEEHAPHIFERFYRADPSRHDGGAGLGLAITRGIVEAHKGRIWMESAPGAGARFSFALPREKQGAAP